jgi:hypothetical protein
MELKFIPVAPMFIRNEIVHANDGHGHSGFREMPIAHYPPTPNGEQLRRLRLNVRNMTLREMAAWLSVDVGSYSAIETGRKTLSDEQWRELLNMVGTRNGVPPASVPQDATEVKRG